MDVVRRHRRKKPLSRPFVVTVAAVGAGLPIAVGVGVGAGCGDSKPPYASSGGGPTSTASGPCTEGAARACAIDLGTTSQGYHSCFAGTQTCTAGSWSKCGGEGVVTNSKPGAVTPAGLHPGPGGLTTQATYVDGSPGANICTSDPCNPYCLGWDLTEAGVLEGGSVVGVGGFGDLNPGKFLDDPCSGNGNPPPCDFKSGGSLFACQLDTYCNLQALGGNGCCKQFVPGETYPAANTNPYLGTEPGIDLTADTPCNFGGVRTYQYLPVCNRGTVAVPGGVGNITVDTYNASSTLPTSSCPAPDPSPTCSMPVPATGIAPGVCILLDMAAYCSGGIPGGGIKFLYVNADFSIPEGPVTPQASPPLASAQPVQPGCADNWSGTSKRNNPPACFTSGTNSTTFSDTYVASCPVGSKVQWSSLTWDSTCPANGSGSSEVTFDAATAPLVDGGPGTFSAFITVGEAQNSTPTDLLDPEICQFTQTTDANCSNADTLGIPQTGPTPPCCPKNFLNQFQRPTTALPFPGVGVAQGLQLAQQEVLTLQITLTTSPDGLAVPTLNSWQVSYSCLPSE
jgi:hypothetical protein